MTEPINNDWFANVSINNDLMTIQTTLGVFLFSTDMYVYKSQIA